MKITIAGSLGNVSKPLALQLIKAGHQITIISSKPDKQKSIEALGAKAAIGSVNDAAFLAQAFNGADAVYVMTPPNMGGSNIIENNISAGKAFASAIQQAGVKRVVMLSSIGADKPEGNGPIKALHHIENLYRQLEDVAITFLRAGYFYFNFFNDIPVIKGMNIMGANYPAGTGIQMVHPEDIAMAAAEELQKPSTGKQVRYIVSDVRSAGEIAGVFGAAIGKPELPWVEFTDAQSLQGMIQAGLPEEIAGLYTEMGAGFRNGILTDDFLKQGAPIDGKIKLEQFAEEFAANF